MSSNEQSTPSSPATRSSFWLEQGHSALWLFGALWLAYSCVWLLLSSSAISNLDFRDPDDAMRLIQVRDFLAGQSWFDISQHRVNPPAGGPMHWARLVDLPYAALILLLRPFIGQGVAEMAACAIVPLILLGATGLALFTGIRRLTGDSIALLAVILLGTSFPIIIQFAPMRIDHHGWQIMLAACLLWGMLHANPARGGWIMGGAIAAWLDISSEGLPYAALVGGVLTLRYALKAEEWPRLIRYVGTLAVGSLILLVITHGVKGSLTSYCDAMSPVYLAPLLLMLPIIWFGRSILGDGSMMRRIAPVAGAGLVAVATFAMTGGKCLSGPFRTLDPLIYDLWYMGVKEGLPLWQQTPAMQLVILLPSLVGLIGLLLAIHQEKQADKRFQWLCVLAIQLGCFAISILILRAMAVSHMFALIGIAYVICAAFARIRSLRHALPRALLTVSLVLLSPPGIIVGADQLLASIIPPNAQTKEGREKTSFRTAEIQALSALSPGVIFTPLDIGPAVLVRTAHKVIGTGHHRNVDGIGKVISAFTAPPQKAEQIIRQTPSAYVLFVPKLNEIQRYAKYAPDGLAAELGQGKIPAWLEPVPLKGLGGLRLYRVMPVTTEDSASLR